MGSTVLHTNRLFDQAKCSNGRSLLCKIKAGIISLIPLSKKSKMLKSQNSVPFSIEINFRLTLQNVKALMESFSITNEDAISTSTNLLV
jgi:hypothetical protein